MIPVGYLVHLEVDLVPAFLKLNFATRFRSEFFSHAAPRRFDGLICFDTAAQNADAR